MKDNRDRVTVSSWMNLKKYIPYSSTDGYTPRFGYLMDQFRIQYGIYISVIPVTKSSLTKSADDTIVFSYRIDIYKISGNNVITHWTGNEQAYYLAMRKALDKAIDFIND